jgi:hypothetical protein
MTVNNSAYSLLIKLYDFLSIKARGSSKGLQRLGMWLHREFMLHCVQSNNTFGLLHNDVFQ